MTRKIFIGALGLILSQSGISHASNVWGKDLAEGPVRALFISTYGAHQDSYEMMQRFDIQGKVIAVARDETAWGFNGGAFGLPWIYHPHMAKQPEIIMDEIRSALSGNWETLLMSGTPAWSKYPQDIRDKIIEKVAAGKSLILANSDGSFEAELSAKGIKPVNLNLLEDKFRDSGAAIGKASVYSAGKGFVAYISVPNHASQGYLLSSSDLESDFEISAARVGWIMRQIAHPGVIPVIGDIKASQSAVSVSMEKSLPAGSILSVSVRRHSNYAEVFSTARKIKPGQQVSIPLPYIAGGDYRVVARVTANGKTLDWEACGLRVTRSVAIKNLSVSGKEVSPGGDISCNIALDGSGSGLTATARWYDGWNRLLSEAKGIPYSEKIALKVPKGSMSVMNRLEITLASKSGPEAVASTDILMQENIRPTDFHVLYWSTGLNSSWRSRLYYDRLRQTGAGDGFSNCGNTEPYARMAAMANMRTVPYTTVLHMLKMKDQLFDPNWREKTLASAKMTARGHGPYNPVAYTLGDENYMDAFTLEGRFADTPLVWDRFREYLKSVYPGIDSLNRQWGTSYAGWQDIHFSDEKSMLSGTDNPSMWTDYRMFVAHEYSGLLQELRSAIKEEDPDAAIGFDAGEQFASYDGYDWWQMTRGMDLVQTYSGYIVPGAAPTKIFNGEALKSFNRKTSISGGWLNSADFNYGGQFDTWYLFLNGWNSIWWWHATFMNNEVGAFTWDQKMTPVIGSAVEAAKEIKSGPGTLLAKLNKEIDPIVVHYSENNWHASTIDGGVGNHVNNLGVDNQFWSAPNMVNRLINDEAMNQVWGKIASKGHYAAASKNFYYLLHDLGFEPRTMARQEIEAGELGNSGTKLLVLPFVVSLSDAEAEKIRAFVKDGGTVIADYRCGMRDLHCKLREKPALDDVFGIKRADNDIIRSYARVVAEYGWECVGASYNANFHEAISADGATVMGYHDDGTPAYLINSYGKGKAVYLNSDLYEYESLRNLGHETGVRELFTRIIFQTTKMLPQFVPEYKGGKPVGHTEVTRYRDGAAWYIGLLPAYRIDNKTPVPARLMFPDGLHIYDVREKKYMGNSGVAYFTLEPGEAELFAALPYKITAVQASGPKVVKRGEEASTSVSVKTDTGDAVGHAVRVEVVLPDGSRPEYMARTVYLPGGKGVYTFIPALSEPSGRWSIRVVEAVSGKEACTEIVVR